MTNERRHHLDQIGLALLVLCVSLWMVRSHWESVDGPNMEGKHRLHAKVVANEARDPYQYKLWLISEVFEGIAGDNVVSENDTPLDNVFYGNTLLSILFFMLCHHLWLRTYVDPRTAALGAVLMGALSLTLFRGYQHHPYEFWGLGLFCLLLQGIQQGRGWIWLCVLGLFTGLVWEKHALLAPLWGLWRLMKKDAFWPAFGKGLAFLACCLAVPIAVRLYLDGLLPEGVARGAVDGDTPFHAQKWHLVAWYQGAYILPFVFLLVLHFKAFPRWVRLTWIYLPVLFGLYLGHDYIIHETRSFYAIAPVFTATLCIWIERLGTDGSADAVVASSAP